MARLILHSDDFGLHPEVNRGIVTAAEEGVLTSASLLMNGAAVEDAVARALRCPSLGVGLHLNIVRGRPLADPAEVPSLVTTEGRFFNSVGPLLWRSMTGRLSAADVHREYRLQYLRMREHGLEPTHVDGEKHTHVLLPEASLAVKRLSDEFGIAKVRIIAERNLTRMLRARGIPVRATSRQRLKLRLLERRSRKVREVWTSLRSPEASFGVLLSGSEDYRRGPELLRAILSLEPPRSVEWMFHVGFPAPLDSEGFRSNFGKFFLTTARAKELEFLRSEAVCRELRAARERVISYKDL